MSGMLAQAVDGASGGYQTLLVWAGGSVALVLLLALILFVKAFKKTSADKAFVRTGWGRAKVVVDGGAFVIGIFHQVKWISLETMRLTVDRRGRDALITKDRYRVDITCDFFVRVEPNNEQILRASRSLGEFSLTPESVMDLVGAKLVGALRSVAATRTLLDLHEKRDDFADNVQEALHQDLQKNGLTLESVSIVNLDQTEMAAYDQNNVFDAEGLKKIVEETAERQIRKNEIENKARVEMKQQDVMAAVSVKEQDVEGRKRQLHLEREEEYAQATQTKEVEVFKAERSRETLEFKYEQEESVRKREIAKNQSVQEAQIATELKLSQDGIAKDKSVREAQIAAEQKIKTDTIAQERAVEQARLEKETYLVDKQREREEADISRQLAVERATRDKQIGIIEKDKEQELAEAARLAVVAEREAAEQNVYLVEQRAEAERNKQVALIEQQAESEKEQIAKQVAADAEAYEIMKRAEARLSASEMEAKAKRILAEAILAEAEARAEGERKLIEAKNITTESVLAQEAILALIEQAPELMREAMKPAEKISEIRVIHAAGLAGGGGGGEGQGIAGKIVGSVLEAGAALPLLKELMKAADIDSEKGLGELARQAVTAHPAMKRLLERIPDELRRQSDAPEA